MTFGDLIEELLVRLGLKRESRVRVMTYRFEREMARGMQRMLAKGYRVENQTGTGFQQWDPLRRRSAITVTYVKDAPGDA